MNWFWFVIGSLATFRLSLLVTKEDGPMWIFQKLRKVPKKTSSAHDWLSCIFCFSVTASAIVCGVFWLSGIELKLGLWFLVWLAFSSFAILLNQKFTKGPL